MKIKQIIIFVFAITLMSCENQENSFPDFGSTSVYFPFQTPIRTLIQGKYDLGNNDNDNLGRFEIGVIMSGVYENTKDRKVGFELAPELIDAAALGVDTVNVKVLPSSYYTIEQTSPVTIPAGSTKGRIPVQLNDAFFDDPLSFAEFGETHYVIPLKITDYSGLDSLLTGVSVVDNPIRIRDEDWSSLPKDYTLFGIKFINKYEGIYLRRGEDKVVGTSQTVVTKTSTGDIVESGDIENINGSTVYRAANVVQDDPTKVTTSGKNKGIYTNNVNRPGIVSSTVLSLQLVFNDNEEITITNSDVNSPFIVTGTGRFLEDGDEWGGENRDVIYLEYEYQDKEVNVSTRRFGSETVTSTLDLIHTVKDTLVIRNRDVKFEEFIIDLEKK
ncbi:DUF5627 domain-containing protein [uncultured Polaribacter sp.]|uniref:DUF5627 domain-containing protein n=1 Tax=uncultured Polaribacter sp. TaxID=174711 RepID=UPI00261C29B5|nr:DUF5627 domain-containing protein [uncultured Polaribacter sp.]